MTVFMACMLSLYPSIHSLVQRSWGQLQPISAVRRSRQNGTWTSCQFIAGPHPETKMYFPTNIKIVNKARCCTLDLWFCSAKIGDVIDRRGLGQELRRMFRGWSLSCPGEVNTTALAPAGSACSHTLTLPATAEAEALGVKTRDPVCASARVSPPLRLTHPNKWVKLPQTVCLSHTVTKPVTLFRFDRLKDGREHFFPPP